MQNVFNQFWPFEIFSSWAPFVLGFLVLGSCLLTLTAFLGSTNWLFDLTAHFRLQYLVLQALAVLYLSVLPLLKPLPKANLSTVLFALILCLGLNLWKILPYYSLKYTSSEKEPPQKTFKILHINLLKSNRNKQAVQQLIDASVTDLLSLQEYGKWWQQSLELQSFPYKVVSEMGELALFSKIPIDSSRIEFISDQQPTYPNYAHLMVKIKTQGESCTVIAAHPPLPPTPFNQEQNRFFEKWVRERQSYGPNVLIIGDLNTTPWSHSFQKLINETDLWDSQIGKGLQPSWPTFFPLMGIPIDHVLLSPSLSVVNRQTGPEIGSDHRPVMIEVGLKQKGSKTDV